MAGAQKRISFTRLVAGGLVLGAGGFGLLRATHAEPLPVPTPTSLAEPRPDPNALVVPKLDALPPPALPVPEVVPAAVPVAPLVVPTVPMLPVPDLKPAAPLPVPSVPSLPVPDLIPKAPELVQPAHPIVPVVPSVPSLPEKPENTLRPAPAPLTLKPVEPAVPAPLKPEALPVGNEIPRPPRKVGDEVIGLPKPVSSPETKVPRPLTIAPTPGDYPMLSIQKLTLSTTLGVALALASTSAIKAEEPKTELKKTTEETLKQEIKDLKEELKKSKDLLNSIDELVLGRKDGQIKVPADAGLLARMTKLEKAIAALEMKVTSLDESLTKRTAGASPTEKNLVGKGIVKVVNEFATKITITINDKSYPLDPLQTKEVEVPTGNFSYLLLADGAVKTTSGIKENETVTLRIR